jgi:hypothetical protein
MQFTRTLSVKHHPTGDHYVLSIPRPVAEALNLHENGGLVSIEMVNKLNTHKNGVRAQVVLKSYRNSHVAWTEKFDPTRTGSDLFKPVVIPPRTLGVSRPWGCGKVFDPSIIRELRAARLWITTEFRRAFPSSRGRRRKCR